MFCFFQIKKFTVLKYKVILKKTALVFFSERKQVAFIVEETDFNWYKKSKEEQIVF